MRHSTFASVAALCVAASFTAGAANAASLAEAAKLLSANETKTLEFSGAGHWFQFGQAPVPGGDWPKFDVSAYKAAVDFDKVGERVLITRQQTPDGRQRPAPTEQKVDANLLGDKAWNVAPPQGAAPGAAPVATAQPASVEERTAEIWSTPQGFLKAALANNAKSENAGGGVEVSFSVGKNRYVGTIGADNHVSAIKTWIDTPVLGDTQFETHFSDYKDFGGLHFPTQIHRVEGGHEVLHVVVAEAKANAPVDIAAPANLVTPPAASVVASEKLGEGVWYLTGGTHHSVAVEEKDHVVLIEAPLNEERSLALIQKIGELVPGKPIKFVVNSHVHFDHSGGLRTFVDAGATIVTQDSSKAYYEKAWAAPHTLHPDRLAASKKAPVFKTYEHKLTLGDDRPIEIHHIAGSGHADDLALAYVPGVKLVVEADAWTPAAVGAPPPKTPNPFSVNLYENFEKLGLNVERVAGLHGRVATVDELRAAIGRQTAAK